MAENFDEVLIMRQGRLMESGSFDALRESNEHLKELLESE
jgi:ABC-type multidrug transport system fused ATPase/permease subunit